MSVFIYQLMKLISAVNTQKIPNQNNIRCDHPLYLNQNQFPLVHLYIAFQGT